MCLNSTINISTGYTPYFLATGREIVVDGKLHHIHSIQPSKLFDLDVMDREKSALSLKDLSDIFVQVQSALTEAYQRNASRYNRRRKHTVFKTDDIVWRRNFVQSNAANFFSNKLAPRFVKCKIQKKLSDVVYLLTDLATGKSGKYHIKDILKLSINN